MSKEVRSTQGREFQEPRMFSISSAQDGGDKRVDEEGSMCS